VRGSEIGILSYRKYAGGFLHQTTSRFMPPTDIASEAHRSVLSKSKK